MLDCRYLYGFRLNGGAVVAVAVAVAVLGCDAKDAEKCRQGQDGVRASLKANDSGALQKWRDFTFKVCEDGEFSALDREISEKQATKQQAEAEAKRKKQENDQLLTVFLDWVGSTKAAPQNASAAQCTGDADAEKNQERWCVGDRVAGANRLEVVYWEKEPLGAAYKITVPNPVTCEALGPHTVVRTWMVQGSIKRHHCQITGGQAAGMQALVTEAQGAPVEVFSARFVELHAGMKKKLEGI